MPHPPVSVRWWCSVFPFASCQAGNVQGHSYRLSDGWDQKTVTHTLASVRPKKSSNRRRDQNIRLWVDHTHILRNSQTFRPFVGCLEEPVKSFNLQ